MYQQEVLRLSNTTNTCLFTYSVWYTKLFISVYKHNITLSSVYDNLILVNHMAYFMSIFLYSFSTSWFVASIMGSRMVCHIVPHSWAAFKCILYRSLFSLCFSLYKNFISSFIRMKWIFFWITSIAGEVCGTFILAWLATTFLIRHFFLVSVQIDAQIPFNVFIYL